MPILLKYILKTIYNKGSLNFDINMNLELLDFLVKIILVVIAAFIASSLAINKFYKERNWERREKAYAEIINALYDLIKYFRVYKEDYGQGTGLSENIESELYANYISAASSLSKATDIGSFYISKSAYETLSKLKTRKQLNFNEEPMFEIYDSEFQHHQLALNEFLEIAKKDLKVE